MEKIIGINPVKEALKSGRDIEKIEIYKGITKDKSEEIIEKAKIKGIDIKFIDKKGENDQGVTAYIKDYNYTVSVEEFLEKIYNKKNVSIVILDGIQDPRNFGAVIRSCEAFGIDGIIIPDRNNVKVNETVVKTSTGAIEYVDIIEVNNISNAIEKIKKYGFWVYGAEADGTKNYYDENYPERVCLVLGSEGNGIRKKVKEHCDIMLNIPMMGKINSLNVSVAGGILLAEISKNGRG